MKWLTLCVLVCLTRFCHGGGEEIKCTPNTTFTRDCNTCLCLENGLGLCTLKNCHSETSSVPKKSELVDGKECAADSLWRSQCNECICSPDGYSFCTEKACPGQESEPLKRCAPDSMWKDDCNTCWCTKDGLPICTRVGCVDSSINNSDKGKGQGSTIAEIEPNVKSTKNTTQKIVCVANKMFVMDCNTCWCNDDGTSFFCTRKVCVEDLPEESGNEDKKPEIAAQIRRTRGADQEVRKNCQPGTQFRLDCNTCLCDNTGQEFSCTRHDCIAANNNNGGGRSKRGSEIIITTPCTPGSVFNRDCNVCRCIDDGIHATCTASICPMPNSIDLTPTTTTEAESSFRCNPGEQFKRNCNDCSCSADGKSVYCTVRFCDQDMTPPPSF